MPRQFSLMSLLRLMGVVACLAWAWSVIDPMLPLARVLVIATIVMAPVAYLWLMAFESKPKRSRRKR